MKGLAAILFIVWSMMMLGCWVIGAFIVPLQLDEVWLTSVAKAALSACLAFTWLFFWRRLALDYFRRSLSSSRK